jgi:hypothetical protein
MTKPLATKRSGARLYRRIRLSPPSHVCVLRTAPRSGRHPFASVPSSTGHYAAVGDRVRLFTRNGYDFTARFPKIAAAVADLAVWLCVVDGEAIVVNREGLSVFDLLRYRHHTMLRCSAPSI